MRRIIAMLVAGYMSLVFSVPMAGAISSVKAKADGDSVKVSGKGAAPGADIEWEGEVVGVVNSDGEFEFNAPLPSNCIGEVFDGVMTLDVTVEKCTPLRALVPQTGQTAIFATGDEGDVAAGIKSPVPRFTDNGDGTVTDNLRGLVWLKDANCAALNGGSGVNWATALSNVNSLADSTCGLMDGSMAGDWYLPNVRELHSLIDFGNSGPALPTGHPFTNVLTKFYWSSTTFTDGPGLAWPVSFGNGNGFGFFKSSRNRVLAVRGGS